MSEGRTGMTVLFDEAEEAGREAMELLLELKPELRDVYDARSMRLAREDMAHHIRNLAAVALGRDSGTLHDYLSWLKVLFDGLGISDESISMSFRCVGHAVKRRLDEDDARIFNDLVERAVFEYGRSEPATNRYLKEGLPGNALARAYVQALIDGKRDLAQSLVDAQISHNTPVRELYLGLFQPAMCELGRLWHTRKVTVAQEHFGTATTQSIMSSLHGNLVSGTRPNGKRMIAACAQGEFHEMGLRMVSDFFEADGWDTRYLGANLPVDSLVGEIARDKPDLVALSATTQPAVRWIQDAIKSIHENFEPAPVIMVGGAPFIISDELWSEVGADATAPDCGCAVKVAARIFGIDEASGK